MDSADLLYSIHTHLLYEVRWLIFAASRFEAAVRDDPEVALIDSAAVHARNLLEFAEKRATDKFTLHALGGRAAALPEWKRWANNRVTHMLERETHHAPWPDGLDNGRRDRLTIMAGRVLDRLEDGGTTMPSGDLRDAYAAVIGAARIYWRDPTQETHGALAALYDASRDGRDYNAG